MNNVPKHLKDKWSTEKPTCIRQNEGTCDGRLTKDHTIIFGGKQLQEDWAIVDVCEYHHAVNKYQSGGDLNRELNTYHALLKATDQELMRVSKAINYLELKKRLSLKYENNNNRTHAF